jgi:hypothetical protein
MHQTPSASVLEPWLTESHWDEHYWDDVARTVVEQAGEGPSHTAARNALAAALRSSFPDIELEADNGLYRDNLDRRLDLIVDLALESP